MRTKNISNPIYGIDGHKLKCTDRIIYNKNRETVWISSFIRYKAHSIFLNKNGHSMSSKEILVDRKNKEKVIENKIRLVMKKDVGISPKKIADLTGVSVYKVYRYYTIIRRENSK